MLRPPTGCSTFIVFDFIRVPPPAARTIAVRLSMLLPSPVDHAQGSLRIVLPG